jgi:hypothetical protein
MRGLPLAADTPEVAQLLADDEFSSRRCAWPATAASSSPPSPTCGSVARSSATNCARPYGA